MLPSTELFTQVQREHVLQAIAQIEAGAQSRFADSTKFDVLHKGNRYAPKEVGGLALEVLTGKGFGPNDFKGGERSPCFNALERCGFLIVPKKEIEPGMPLSAVVAEILTLQTKYSSKNTEEMKRRGVLIRSVLPDRIRDRLEDVAPLFMASGYECSVEGSDGVGRKNESPWVRIFDPEMSPSATQGWYVVIHFSRDGKHLFVTVGCGATVFKGGSLVDVPAAELGKQVQWARGIGASSDFPMLLFDDQMDLRGNALSRQFEKATAFAKTYEIGAFDEDRFWEDIETLSKLLVVLYEGQRLGKAPLSDPPDVLAAQKEVEAIASPGRRGGKGQGRGLSPAERMAVERQAMKVAKEGLVAAGFTNIKDTSASESYDYSAQKDGTAWSIEVKGTTSASAESFLLTAPELRHHRNYKGQTVLALVSDIELTRADDGPVASAGKLDLSMPWDPDEWDFDATAFRATRKSVV